MAASGRKWSTPGLVLQADRRPADDPARAGASLDSTPRVGFTCSRKVGGAVERNRAKRRLRALAAELLPTLGEPGTDYVLVGRPATVHRPFDLLRADLTQALQRVGRPRREPRP